jgi:hypothetical protein
MQRGRSTMYIQQSNSTNYICGIWDYMPSLQERVAGYSDYMGEEMDANKTLTNTVVYMYGFGCDSHTARRQMLMPAPYKENIPLDRLNRLEEKVAQILEMLRRSDRCQSDYHPEMGK